MKDKLQIFTVYLGMYCAAFSFTIIFPFASEMVMSFGVSSDRDTTGTWVGIIATSMLIGRFITSPFWGYIVDTWGRKPVTQFSLASLSVLQVLFGLSKSLLAAIIIRSCIGMLTPIMISSKTMATDLLKNRVSDAMVWTVITWNIGSISGSLLGGIFSDTNSKGFTDIPLFDEYPYLLCCLITSAVSLLAFVLGFLCLKETLISKAQSSDQVSRTISAIIRDNKVWPVCVTYAFMGLNGTAFQELITLWCWAKRGSGGLELSTTKIGLLLGISNFSLLFIQRQLFGFLESRMGLLNISKYGFLCLVLVTSVLTLTPYIQNDGILYVIVIILCTIWYFLDFAVCTAILVMLNHSVPLSELGRLNGVSMSFNTLFRALSPVIIGSLFSSTIKSPLPKPINYSTTFYFLSLIEFFGFLVSFKIDQSIQHPAEKTISEIPLIEIED